MMRIAAETIMIFNKELCVRTNAINSIEYDVATILIFVLMVI